MDRSVRLGIGAAITRLAQNDRFANTKRGLACGWSRPRYVKNLAIRHEHQVPSA